MTAGRSYGGEAPDDRVARRRRQLLDAGLEVVGTVGYRAATVRGICRAARVTDRYFYESFPTTEDLLLAVYAECLERLRAGVSAGLAAAGPGADVPTAARAGVAGFFAEVADPRLARVVWLEVLGVSPRVDAAYAAAQREFAALMTGVLRAAAPAGDLGVVDEELLGLAAVGGINQVATVWLLEGYRRPPEHVVDAATQFLVGVGRAVLG
ncbi:TetR family transcriptional regulator [Rhodococcus aerolatus]